MCREWQGLTRVPPCSKRSKKGEKGSKGLRHFSMKVCEKVQRKGVTTYNEVADELVGEFTDPRSLSFSDQVTDMLHRTQSYTVASDRLTKTYELSSRDYSCQSCVVSRSLLTMTVINMTFLGSVQAPLQMGPVTMLRIIVHPSNTCLANKLR